MKRIIAWILCLVLFCGMVSFASADVNLPQQVASYFSDPKFKGADPVEAFSLGGYFFVLVKADTTNTLYIFKDTNSGYKYWARTTDGVPQGAGRLEMTNYSGNTAVGSRVKFNNPTIEIRYYDKKASYPMYTVDYSLINGNWLLKNYADAKNDLAVAFKEDTLTYYLYGTEAKQGSVEGTFQRDIRYCGLKYIPTSLKNAKNKLTVAPELPEDSELVAENIKFTGGKKYAVFTGPGKDYLRGAKKKASVSTNDWIQVFGEDDGWILIQYAVKKDTYRFGYIEAKALPKNTKVKALDFNTSIAVTVADTEITDDPLHSKQKLGTVPAGEEVLWFATMDTWAYVETDVDDVPVRGFVPVSMLQIPEDTDNFTEEE